MKIMCEIMSSRYDFILYCLCTIGQLAYGVLDTTGTHFIFNIPVCTDGKASVLFVPQSNVTTSVVIMYSFTLQEVVLYNGGGKHVKVNCTDTRWNTIQTGYGITVRSSHQIVIYVEQQTDSYIVHPVNTLGSSYIIATFSGENNLAVEFWFTIIASKDFTIVNINATSVKRFTKKFAHFWFHRGHLFRMELNIGDTISVLCKFDVSGIEIYSNNPIFVLFGEFHKNGEDHNVFIEAALPENSWGNNFILNNHGQIKIIGRSAISFTINGNTNNSFHFDSTVVHYSHNCSGICLLLSDNPVWIIQRKQHLHSHITSMVLPVALYTKDATFSNDNIHTCSAEVTSFKAERLSRTIDLPSQEGHLQNSTPVLINYGSHVRTENINFEKYLHVSSYSSLDYFSGFISCQGSSFTYSLPHRITKCSHWVGGQQDCLKTSKEGNSNLHIKMNDFNYGPYLPASIASVTISLCVGVLAVLAFIGFMYITDKIRNKLAIPSRINPQGQQSGTC